MLLKLLKRSKMLVALLISGTCVSFHSQAHPEDGWQDSSEYIVGDSHLLIIRHFSTEVEALSACISHAAKYGYEARYCNSTGNDEYRLVAAGWLRHSPTAVKFDFLKFYYDRYYIGFSFTDSCKTNNPCSIGDGAKHFNEVDFSSNGPNALKFERKFSTASKGLVGMAPNWQHNFSSSSATQSPFIQRVNNKEFSSLFSSKEEACLSGWNELKAKRNTAAFAGAEASFSNDTCKITKNGETQFYLPLYSQNPSKVLNENPNLIKISRPSGKIETFEKENGAWINFINPKITLTEVNSTLELTLGDGSKEIYNLSGNLVETRTRNNFSKFMKYDLEQALGGDGNPATLDSITNTAGDQLKLTYNSLGQITVLNTPTGDIKYEYSENGNLTKVTYQDETFKEYRYENTNFPHYVTSIIDEKGITYANVQYDIEGRATLSELAGGVEKLTLQYFSDGRTKTTDVTGATRTYDFELVNGWKKVKSVTGEPCTVCSYAQFKAQTFDQDGNRTSRTDWNNNVTQYEYTNNLETKKTLAAGTVSQKIISRSWDEQLRLPQTITEDNRFTEFEYDAAGNLLKQTVTDLLTQEKRITTHQYNAQGLLESTDGPRTDVNDLTQFEYDSSARLTKIINALGHTTEFKDYNGFGLPETIIYPNGAVETRTYSARGRMLTSVVNGTSTSFEYDAVGQLTKITKPGGVTQQFEYDGARRLTAIVDSQGNRTEYTLDLSGNVTETKIKKLDGTVSFSQSNNYSNANKLLQSISGEGVTQTFSYDDNGNVIDSKNGKNHSTSSFVDELSRVSRQIDAEGGVTSFDYDQYDNLTSVTDAENNNTSYEYNAFGDRVKQTSQDSGVTTYLYDEAGNIKSKTDAKGIVTQYDYDALNRLLSVSYPNTAENITYAYDDISNGVNGLGKLTSVVNTTETINYSYNLNGQLTKESKVINGKAYNIEYIYDSYGRLSSTVYPSGLRINYILDLYGKLSGVTSGETGQETTLASNIEYLPFGPLTQLTYGNNHVLTNEYDLDYRLTRSAILGIKDKIYSHDLANNISEINDSANADNSSFSYDKLSRLLTNQDSSAGDSSFTYDKIGDRLTHFINGETNYYAYPDTKNQLSLVTNDISSLGLGEPVYIDATLGATHLTPAVHASQIGKEIYYICPSSNQLATVYGTDVYSTHSNVCSAAVHQGVISLSIGGSVKVTIVPSEASYPGSTRNGVTSRTWSSTSGAFTISGINPNETLAANFSWYNSLSNMRNHVGFSFLAKCSGPGSYGYAWGTEIYTDNSQVCKAAQHMGYVNNTTGEGFFKVTLIGPQTSHQGSTQNGVTSMTAGSYPGSYQISPAQISSGTPDVIVETSFVYDANGNTIQKGDLAFTYNDANRMASSSIGGVTTTYQYNAKGERVVKKRGGLETHYIFGLNGQLIAEADGNGNILKEYVYFSGQPLAQIIGDNIYYYHNSHLGTPEVMTDASQNIIWQASYTPFGKATVLVNNIENNIRFPGQYYDAESGLHYNYFRDYDPEIGRYVQSDPIGLAGGINTYGYVEANPIIKYDPNGLTSIIVCGNPANAATCTTIHGGSSAAARAAARSAATGTSSNNEDPDCDEDPCEKIQNEMREVAHKVRSRAEDMLVDKCNQFEEAYFKPDPNATCGKGTSFIGHRRAMKDTQNRLNKLIKKAKKNGCSIPEGVWKAALRGIPLSPRGR